ncbi:hypothetical protein EAI_10051 [Harpegnathos saltator]|uniref:Uncharacterized protein n=1 Tax=Harpegnathos saltator TaxID=610380 RepID=E2BJB3_HARSA|nr:hypothetical protein EAI_10051 [Harpegnathos saltator]
MKLQINKTLLSRGLVASQRSSGALTIAGVHFMDAVASLTLKSVRITITVGSGLRAAKSGRDFGEDVGDDQMTLPPFLPRQSDQLCGARGTLGRLA